MKVTRGKVHEYLGMTIDFRVKGQVKITMPKHIQALLDFFDKISPKATGTKTSAAPKDLFTVDDNCKKLSKERLEQYHSIVAQALFSTKQARPDNGTSILFLTTRVREPNEDDWRKWST